MIMISHHFLSPPYLHLNFTFQPCGAFQDVRSDECTNTRPHQQNDPERRTESKLGQAHQPAHPAQGGEQ